MKKKDIKNVQKLMEKVTLEDIRETLNGFWKENPKEPREPKITHYEWEEDGQKYSSWKIDTGNSILNTGDGGMELFLKAFKEGFNKPLKYD